MKKRIYTGLALASLLAPLAAFAAGPGYYLDAEVGQEWQTFRPHYDFAAGGPSQTFIDKSEDHVIAVRAGHAWRLSERLSLAAQMRFAHANNDWVLQTGEPASLSFSIANSLSAGVVAQVEPAAGWSLTAELALGKGEVKERKQAAMASNYSFNEWTTHQAWALGIGRSLTDALSLNLEYRQTEYSSFKYTSARLGSAAVVETIRDAPSVRDLSLALRYRW